MPRPPCPRRSPLSRFLRGTAPHPNPKRALPRAPVEDDEEAPKRRRAPKKPPPPGPLAGLPAVEVLSYGGGADSFAMLIGALYLWGPRPDLVIFADVTDAARRAPGEWPETYRHIERIVLPLLRHHGIPFVWLRTEDEPVRDATSLYEWNYEQERVPAKNKKWRFCTVIAKVDRIVAELDRRYPPEEGRRLRVSIGFEAGEEERVAMDPHAAGDEGGRRANTFPLLDRRICRCRAVELVRALGFPAPAKSACTFCPFGSRVDFAHLRVAHPLFFAQAAELEANVQLTRAGKFLRLSGNYQKGDDTDPTLREWTTGSFYTMIMPCTVCGSRDRVSKAAGEGDPFGEGPVPTRVGIELPAAQQRVVRDLLTGHAGPVPAATPVFAAPDEMDLAAPAYFREATADRGWALEYRALATGEAARGTGYVERIDALPNRPLLLSAPGEAGLLHASAVMGLSPAEVVARVVGPERPPTGYALPPVRYRVAPTDGGWAVVDTAAGALAPGRYDNPDLAARAAADANEAHERAAFIAAHGEDALRPRRRPGLSGEAVE